MRRPFSGFSEEDFRYFPQVRRANREGAGHPSFRRTEAQGREVQARLAALGEELLPGVRKRLPDAVLHVGELGAGRFAKTLFVAFYRRRAGHPSRDLQLSLELGEPGLRVALRFGAARTDPDRRALQERFAQQLHADPAAPLLLAELARQGFSFTSEGAKDLPPEDFWQDPRGRVEKVLPRAALLERGPSLVEELRVALEQLFGLYRYVLDARDEPEQGLVESLGAFAHSRGFSFALDELVCLLAALATRPFVVLAGVSGTGKTKLAQLAAEFFCGPSAQNPRVAFVSARPDWLDPRGLLGFHDLLRDRYEATPFVELLLHARDDLAPHVVILDEMNLARPEHYLADVLSSLESRRYDGSGRLVSQAPITLHGAPEPLPIVDRANKARAVPRSLEIPPNVYLIGTINLDEASFPLSPRLYDRAAVLALTPPPLSQLLAPPAPGHNLAPGASQAQRDRFQRGGLYSGPVPLAAPLEGRDAFVDALEQLSSRLGAENYPLGVRSARDAFSFAVHAAALGGAPWRWSLDHHLALRVAPRLISQLPLSRHALEALLLSCAPPDAQDDLDTLLLAPVDGWLYPACAKMVQSALLRERAEEAL